jgi:Zn-dependent peptidase ImmA (M78 family)/DNA-binding XRE family transcriptional regulator
MSFESLDVGALSERLVAARKDAGVTQETAAEHLGISRPTFIAIEKGMRRPKPDELVKLAELYGVHINKLLRNDRKPVPLSPHLRAMADSASDGKHELEDAISLLIGYVEDYQFLEGLIGTKPVWNFPPQIRTPVGSIDKFAEHCAREERARLNLGQHQPLHAPRMVLEGAGMHIFIDRLDSELAGLYVFVPDFGYCILVNRLHPSERQRWTIAHEYAHFLVDRDRPGVDYAKPMQRKPQNERFADAFAAAFLMPENGVQRRFYEDIDRTGDFKVGDLCQTANYYGVSLMAMTLRLESLGLISRGSWDEIQAARIPVSKIKEEAGVGSYISKDHENSCPERYKLMAVQAYIEEKISEGQLAKLLRCSRIEAREIVEKCSERSNYDDGEQSLVSLSLSQSLIAGASG